MKKKATIIFLLLALLSKAQLFTGAGGPILNNGQDTFFKLVVSGLSPSQLNSNFGIEEVCIEINHPVNEELYIYLKSPDGKIVELSQGSSSKGANYTSTCFDSKLSNSITMGNPPYSGSYSPTGYLGRFNNGQTGNGTWSLIVHDYLAFVNSGSLNNWSIKFGNSPSAPVAFTSSNLPIVIIKTNNQIISADEIVIDMGIIDNGPGLRNFVTNVWNNYNGKAVINLRGVTSKNFEKKSYSLETHDLSGNPIDASLLNMPAESDWVLIASYTDKTLIRNPITYDLFRKMGHYSSRFRNVEVILNGEYIGVYTLMEKPKRGKDRIDISKLTPTENSDSEITGGYILKIDRPDEPGWYSLLPGNSQNKSHFYYEYIYPKDTAISIPQKSYIKNFMNDFETLMNSSNYANPVNGYSKYLDVESFIDYFIITELNKNVDGYRLSTYLYKDNIKAGGKL
ncbi:MAG: CotH kinase family protein, partial [Bacteroidetes bacterium]|nr:CotH kinase family protein [Bacteroidota bacterium]